MKPKNAIQVFLTLISILFLCSSTAFAGDQVQNQKDIISLIEHENHNADIIGNIKHCFNTLLFYGEVLISEASYKLSHLNNNHEQRDIVRSQSEMEFWQSLQAQYPFTEKPIFISRDSVCGPAYDYVPEGVSEVSITNNSGNILASYTVTKNENGFTIQKGVPSNPSYSYTITLSKLVELDETYGNIGQVQAGEMYIKDQIRKQT